MRTHHVKRERLNSSVNSEEIQINNLRTFVGILF